MNTAHVGVLATRTTAAWCSRNAASVAAFFAEGGSLQINDGVPSDGLIAASNGHFDEAESKRRHRNRA